MDFLVRRMSDRGAEDSPCTGAVRVRGEMRHDYRTCESLEEVPSQPWGREWLREGTGHRVDAAQGMVVREVWGPWRAWVITLTGLEDLVAFMQEHGSVILDPPGALEYVGYEQICPMCIYDDYAE